VAEIHLYVKAQPNGTWQKYAKAGWGQNAFTFQAPRDGEYWFGMVTVDQQGRSTPADITKEEPGLIVIIDRQPPQVELTNLGTSPEGPMIQCEFHDECLDPMKSRFFFQTGDKVFRPLDPVPGKANVYCVPAQAVFTGQLRASATDLAGNVVTRDFHINQVPSPGGQQPTNVAKTEPSVPGKLPMAVNEVTLVEPAPEKGPVLVSQPAPVDKGTPTTHNTHKVQPPANNGQGPALMTEQPSLSPQALPVLESAQAVAQPSPKTRRETVSLQRQLVNSPHVYLEYQIEQAGASGIGKVEVWYTRDQGQSWQRLCEDADRKSPAELDFPGEGLYGINLVISNGRGFGAAPPNPGDAPQWLIEVDTTKPNAEITGVRTIAEGGGTLLISWRAGDKNLPIDGIELYYSSQRQGPWQPIAKGLRNDGLYRWLPPAEVGPQAHLRLVARDAAGNNTIHETAQPVLLDDQSRPRAQILGASTTITPNRTTVTPPQAN
jgi:hypothetical protein